MISDSLRSDGVLQTGLAVAPELFVCRFIRRGGGIVGLTEPHLFLLVVVALLRQVLFQGEKLFALIAGPKKFVRFPDGSHSDLDSFGAQEAVREFLDDAPLN